VTTTTTLPPGRIRRGQLLLTGKLDPRDAHPLELAYATAHILRHPNLDADAFRRSHEDAALAELRASLGELPRLLFGQATLKAVHARLPATECRRCRALMLAKVYKLRPPGFDAATNFLIGEGCDLCRSKSQPARLRAGGAPHTSGPRGPAPFARPSVARLKLWIEQAAAPDPILSNAVRRLLGDQPLPGSTGLPPVSDAPVHSAYR
jgi:hypothetical protein